MDRNYEALPLHLMEPETTFQKPLMAEARAVMLDDRAVEVMTDFRQVRALTVPAAVPMDYASQRMRSNNVHLLLVTDDRNVILGLITSTDVEGDKPMRITHERGLKRSEITVGDVMTPRERLEVIDIDAVLHARVGHVVATLKATGRQHAMVVDRDEQGHQRARGLFAVSQLSRQLGTPIHAIEVARNFVEVESALAHR